MMQKILVIIFIIGALGYLGFYLYRKYFRKDDKCEGCAMGKDPEKTK